MDLTGLTLEDLGRAGFKMYQQKEGFRFGTDSVLLAWFAASFVRENRPVRALELGSGCGGASLCLAARKSGVSIDACEIMERPWEVLLENIRINGLGDRMRAFNTDIRDLPPEVRSLQYDIVFMNPPFFTRERGPAAKNSGDGERLAGRFEENGTLSDFVSVAASRVIQSSGYIIMVMHGDRLADVMEVFSKNRIKPVRLLSVHPFEDRNAAMFLIAGKKGASGTDMKILPPLIINGRCEGGEVVLTDRIRRIYEEEHEDCFIW